MKLKIKVSKKFTYETKMGYLVYLRILKITEKIFMLHIYIYLGSSVPSVQFFDNLEELNLFIKEYTENMDFIRES